MPDSFTTLRTALDAGIFTITLNRPEALNAVNEQMSVELAAALRLAQRDPAIRVVVLTGAGRAFCAGQDLHDFHNRHAAAGAGEGLDLGEHLRQKYNPLVLRLRTMEKPVIAAVNGAAVGGGASFAFAADLRICARSAYFMLAFVHVGLVPDVAATLTLMQHVGYGRAAELCLLGEKLSAEEALHAGLVNRVVEDAGLEAATREMAERLAELPATALGLTKRALNRAWTAELEDQLEYEAFLQQTAGRTADHREGVAAFIEKRRPRFGRT